MIILSQITKYTSDNIHISIFFKLSHVLSHSYTIEWGIAFSGLIARLIHLKIRRNHLFGSLVNFDYPATNIFLLFYCTWLKGYWICSIFYSTMAYFIIQVYKKYVFPPHYILNSWIYELNSCAPPIV